MTSEEREIPDLAEAVRHLEKLRVHATLEHTRAKERGRLLVEETRRIGRPVEI